MGIACTAGAFAIPEDQPREDRNQVVVSCPYELRSLVGSWVDEFNAPGSFPAVTLSESSLDETLYGTRPELYIGYESSLPEGLVIPSDIIITLGRDVYVPVVNACNPYMETLMLTGVPFSQLAMTMTVPGMRSWNELLAAASAVPINYYLVDDDIMVNALTGFLGLSDEAFATMNRGNTEDVIMSVAGDPLAIGFCHLKDITARMQDAYVPGITVLPVDRNNNGKLDDIENFYALPSALNRAVWIGKYPRALSNDLVCTFSGKEMHAGGIAFLKWMVNEGQPYLENYGITDLTTGEKQSALAKIPSGQLMPPAGADRFPYLKFAIMLAIAIIVISFVVQYMYTYITHVRKDKAAHRAMKPQLFSEAAMEVPAGVYFDKTHTWTFMEKDGKVRIGLDDFLPHVTGRLSAVRMKQPGTEVKRGEVILTLVQRGKKLNIKSPVSGTIRSHNTALLEMPSMINRSPYSEGWVYLIEPSNWLRELQFMFMSDKFRYWLSGEFTRLRDFLSIMQSFGGRKLSTVVLQDGGRVREGALEGLSPEAWEEFQTYFIDATS